jgi:mannose-6-phosphate isomerase-like protein (cupin superfamily)
VSEPPYRTAHVDELESIPVTETLRWRPVRRRFGIRAFGVNAYTAANAGDEIVEDHTEARYRHEELYFVAKGHATFTVGGEEIDAPSGTFVFIRDPEVRRHAIAREAGSTVLAIGGRPGEPFRESGWEYGLAAKRHADAGEPEQAVALMREALERHADDGAFLYNLACFEVLAGRRGDALGHLRRAAELEPEKVREWARDDPDLDSIKGELDFG